MNSETTAALTTDARMPYLGFGTYLIPNDQAEAAVREALRAGYRHIDTAEFYKNEEGVGAAIRAAIAAGEVTRKDIFVTTKLFPGNAAWGQTPKTTETTISALEDSLKRLGLEYVDLYLIHAPFNHEQRIAQWRGLVELKKRGKARAIGVSNFSEKHIEELRAAGLPLPDANQIELHPWSQKPALVKYLFANKILPIAYSSLVPLSTWRAAPGQASAKTEQMKSASASDDSPFKAIASKHKVSEAQVLLRWGIEKGYPVLPKSTSPARIKQNADLFSFTLDADDMAKMDAQERGDGVAWPSGDPTKNA